MRAQRRRRQRQRRLIVISLVALVALLFVAMIALPAIQESRSPVGTINQITPQPRPMPEGTAAGDPNAPVRMDVFADFQCVACVQYALTIEPQVMDTYAATGQVYYVFRNYAFMDDSVSSNESKQAANASMCAAEQGRFWDYHDILAANFQGVNQGNFRDRRLVAFAESLDLDMDQFNACFNENRYRSEIQADRAEGERLGGGPIGTPSIFVNGEQLTPGFVPSFEQISEAVEAALAQNP
jgi:protein-disulfide isomerase